MQFIISVLGILIVLMGIYIIFSEYRCGLSALFGFGLIALIPILGADRVINYIVANSGGNTELGMMIFGMLVGGAVLNFLAANEDSVVLTVLGTGAVSVGMIMTGVILTGFVPVALFTVIATAIVKIMSVLVIPLFVLILLFMFFFGMI